MPGVRATGGRVEFWPQKNRKVSTSVCGAKGRGIVMGSNRWATGVLTALAALSAMPRTAATPWAIQTAQAQIAVAADATGQEALADRFSVLARQALASKTLEPAQFRETYQLLDAAHELVPTDPRFCRLMYQAAAQAQDATLAMAAVNALRTIDPADQGAQLDKIDLVLASMQTTDAKLHYLDKLLGVKAIPAEVRSAVAFRAAKIDADRHDQPAVLKMLDQAVRLSPLNLEAMQIQYKLKAAAATPEQRVSMLLQMMRANPAQPVVATQIALELADQGLVSESVTWYTEAFDLFHRTGAGITADCARGVVVEQYLAGQTQASLQLLSQYLSSVPNDADAWFIKLAIEQANDVGGSFAKARTLALVALTNRVADAGKALGDTNATTRPVEDGEAGPMPDLDADLALAQAAKPDLRSYFVDTLADLAWFDIYYQRDTGSAAKLISYITKLDAGDLVLLNRLAGWSHFRDGDFDAARTKLSGVSGRDAMAALGLILIDQADPAKKDAAVAQGQRLLSQHPSGVIGATIFAALGQPTPIAPATNSDPTRVEVDGFPYDWLHIVDSPNNFYSIRAEPVRVDCKFGQPMLLQITLQNLNSYDLAIGPFGVLHSDLSFSAALRGLVEGTIPDAAYDRLTQRIVLHANEGISEIVRVDDGQLASVLSSNPLVAIQAMFSLITNPVTLRNGTVIPGAGGYKIDSLQPIDRASAPLGTQPGRAAVYAKLQSGDTGEKLSALDALRAFAIQIAQSPSAAQLGDMQKELLTNMFSASTDASPIVSGWSRYLLATIIDPDQRAQLVDSLCKDTQWYNRMLGLNAAAAMDDHGAALAQKLSQSDADAKVKAYAAARLDQITYDQEHPTTEPAAAPATEPDSTQPGNPTPDTGGALKLN
jgi:hypothetical protein